MKKPQIKQTDIKVTQEKKDQEIVNACAIEVHAVLEKHNCQLSVSREIMYGQPVFVPVVENKPKK